MKEIHKRRLLNVAKALRESPDPKRFTMAAYAQDCQTPCCAFGHYAYRCDLQDAFTLSVSGAPVLGDCETDPEYVSHDDTVVCDHFGLTLDESCELFDDGSIPGYPAGCGGANTAIEAAEYIEDFVRRRS